MQQAAIRISEAELQLELLDDETPSRWSGPHVGRRLTEAMRTLALLPMGGGSGRAVWPPYCYEWDDLLAKQAQGELERTQQLQNRIRLLPSLRAVTEMELAICWPAEYLGRLPDLLRAVNAVALARKFLLDQTAKLSTFPARCHEHPVDVCEGLNAPFNQLL